VREGARAAASHTGALAGADSVYEAAIGRAGMLRVFEIEEIFDAVETLGLADPPAGERLAIVSNGGGPAVMATDALVAGGGRLAELAPETLERLDRVLPSIWSGANPVDVIGDASAERYEAVLDTVLDDPGVDAVLVLHSPVAVVSGEAVAHGIVRALRPRGPRVLTSWLGGAGADASRAILREAGVPTYLTPEHAARAFLHLVRYRANQARLMETPAYLVQDRTDRVRVRKRIETALDEGREWLTEPESKDVLAGYGVPIVESRVARSVEEALAHADGIGYPVALKVLSPDLVHKSDVGGVALDLSEPEAVSRAWGEMSNRLAALYPEARLDGFLVQRMARRPRAHELIVGSATDPVFGPVMLFGQGGTGVEVIGDRAVELAPLNSSLAQGLVERTRVARLLAGYRDRPAADHMAIVETLVSISRLVTDFPQIVELDVNPLLADETGVVALDARVRVQRSDLAPGAHLAIRPYPRELEENVELEDGQAVLLRPIRPEDEPAHLELFRRLQPEDIRFRFFGGVRRMPHGALARYTQIDYDREMAFIATTGSHPAAGETLGVVRVVEDLEERRAEFAIVVRSDEKSRGLGQALMEKVIRYCEGRGTLLLVGQVMTDNRAMLGLASKLGFSSHPVPDEPVTEVRLPLPRDRSNDDRH
jgi:acetyltransferase